MSSKNSKTLESTGRKYGNPKLINQILSDSVTEDNYSIPQEKLPPAISSTKVVKNIQPKHSSVKQQKKKSYKQLSVYMNKQESELLNNLCEELGLKKSQLLRISLRYYAKKINLE